MTGAAGRPSALRTAWRGARFRCPNCGARTLFRAYLKLNQSCAACGADFSHSETADVAPYVTVFIIGLVAMPSMLILSMAGWGDLVLVPALIPAVALTLFLLPRVKGALAALLWRARRGI